MMMYLIIISFYKPTKKTVRRWWTIFSNQTPTGLCHSTMKPLPVTLIRLTNANVRCKWYAF